MRNPDRLRDETNSEMRQSLLQAIIDASPDGILVVDGDGIIVSHNARFLKIWGIDEHLAPGMERGSVEGTEDNPILASVRERVADRDGFLRRVRELYASREDEDHCEIALRDGRTIERHSRALLGKRDAYLGRVWFFRDVTSRKQTEATLHAEARHDPLTGIMNRRYFAERAVQEFDRALRFGTPLAIAEFDIDHFKRINDEYGHAAGDELLKAVCAAGSRIVRRTNLFARIGGEEFAVLLAGSDLDGARHFAEHLRVTVSDLRLRFEAHEIACTISVGVSPCHADDRAFDACLQRADHAMYRAKENGRNRVEFEV